MLLANPRLPAPQKPRDQGCCRRGEATRSGLQLKQLVFLVHANTVVEEGLPIRVCNRKVHVRVPNVGGFGRRGGGTRPGLQYRG